MQRVHLQVGYCAVPSLKFTFLNVSSNDFLKNIVSYSAILVLMIMTIMITTTCVVCKECRKTLISNCMKVSYLETVQTLLSTVK